MKSVRKVCVCLLLVIFGSIELFSQSGRRPPKPAFGNPMRFGVANLRPYAMKEVDEEYEAALEVQCDAGIADVYLNGIYQGRTPLHISNLMSGFYNLELRKPGFEEERFTIEVKRGYKSSYNVHMHRIVGTIVFANLPSDAVAYVDGSRVYSLRQDVEPGVHQVVVKRFGYEDYVLSTPVLAYETTAVYAAFKPAEFVLSEYTASRNKFNPKYKSGIGRVNFKFKVTTSSTASAVIQNSENKVIREYKWAGFGTWYNSFEWDGIDSEGKVVEDGEYCVTLSAADFEYKLYVVVDSSISYPLVSMSNTGIGVGKLPAVNKAGNAFFLPSFSLASVMNVGNSFGFNSIELNSSFIANFMGHNEISAYFTSDFNFGNTSKYVPVQVGASYKFYNSMLLSDVLSLDYGLFVRYGASDYALFEGVDWGNGLGAGFVLGLDGGFVSAYASSQFVFGAETGIVPSESKIWKNGAGVSFKTMGCLKFDVWGDVHTSVGPVAGAYGNLNLRRAEAALLDVAGNGPVAGVGAGNSGLVVSAYDVGVGANFMPDGYTFNFGMKGDVLIIPNGACYVTAGISFGFMF